VQASRSASLAAAAPMMRAAPEPRSELGHGPSADALMSPSIARQRFGLTRSPRYCRLVSARAAREVDMPVIWHAFPGYAGDRDRHYLTVRGCGLSSATAFARRASRVGSLSLA
jgi:hypothetical protein